jgi:hypothetical protein
LSGDAPFRVASCHHRALGELVQLTVLPSLHLQLTPQEAQSLALALYAVRDRHSRESEIFLSPLASNGYFVAHVLPDGIRVDLPAEGQRSLDWQQVGELADALGG